MPGAGGIKEADYLYSVAPQDGTYWGFINARLILCAAAQDGPGEFSIPTKFQWIGSRRARVTGIFIWTAASPVRSIDDATKQEVIVGATSAGQDTGIFPGDAQCFRRHEVQDRFGLYRT